MKTGYFFCLQSWLLALSRPVNLNFWRSTQTSLKRTFCKIQRTRIAKPSGTLGQFIDRNFAPFGEMELNNISLFCFVFVGAWILWQGSHFVGCFVVQLHSLEGGICRAGWESKPLWEFEPMKDGTLGHQLPHISNLCSVKGQTAQQKRIYWGLILFEILYFEKFSMHSGKGEGFSLHTKTKHTSQLVMRFEGRSSDFHFLDGPPFALPSQLLLLAHCPPGKGVIQELLGQIPYR